LVVDTVNLKSFLWSSRMFLIQSIDEAAVGLRVAYSATYRPVEKCRPETAQGNKTGVLSMIEGISAVTLGTHEMPRTVRFYRALGFEVLHGGEESSFTSLRAGASYLNLIVQPAERRWFWWGRVIFYVTDVDALYNRALAAGYQPATVPRDAEWGERFFHLVDPDGHELSFARPLPPVSVQ
jgi:catechol 2,3-dioxygenase-like lactoylglutathione lyase family enzyme